MGSRYNSSAIFLFFSKSWIQFVQHLEALLRNCGPGIIPGRNKYKFFFQNVNEVSGTYSIIHKNNPDHKIIKAIKNYGKTNIFDNQRFLDLKNHSRSFFITLLTPFLSVKF